MALEPIESDVSDTMNVTIAEPVEQPPHLEAESLDTVKYILLLSFLESRLPRSHILYMISHFLSFCSVLCV